MEINPTRPGGPLPPVADSNQPVNKFSKAARPASVEVLQTGQALKSISADFRKADLQDPAKVDEMLSRCTGELLQSALVRVDGKVTPEAGADLTNWLQNDPVLRGKLLNYLERVLT
jgi:hypothetical protein